MDTESDDDRVRSLTSIIEPAGEFTRRIDFLSAFDKRSDNPSKNYGIGAVRMVFLLIGEKGAVQWMIGTGWYTASAVTHLAGFPPSGFDKPRPSGWDLGYHAKAPKYEGQSPMGHCHVLAEGDCFYDGSSLNAELPIEGFLAGGLDYLWPKLEALYRSTFEDAPWPFDLEGMEARERGAYI